MTRRRLRIGERVALVGVLAGLLAVLAVLPRPFSSPIRRVANYVTNGADPIWNSPAVDGAALRRGGRILPDSRAATYYIWTRPDPQLGHDLIGGSMLFFLPGRPAASPREARWVLSYEAPRRLPAGVRAVRSYTLGPHIYLFRVRPA